MCDVLNAACEQTDRGEAAGKPSSSRGTEGGKEKRRKRTIKRRGEEKTEGMCVHPRAQEGIVLSHVNVLGVGMRGSDAGGLSGKARERGKRLITARHNCPRASPRPAGHVSRDSA